jgi:hypothetical protein
MNKRDSEKLKKRVIKTLLSNGFVATPDGWRDYHGEGSKGIIDVSVRAEKSIYQGRGHNVSVFGVFADPAKARDLGLDCNKFSGKHNFLYINPDSVDYIISQYI